MNLTDYPIWVAGLMAIPPWGWIAKPLGVEFQAFGVGVQIAGLIMLIVLFAWPTRCRYSR